MAQRDRIDEMTERIFCAVQDMDFRDYEECMPDDAAGLAADLDILCRYGSGFVWESLEELLDKIERGGKNGR